MKRDEDVGAWCLVLGRLVRRSLTLSRETGVKQSSQVAWMPGWDWQQLAWNELYKPKWEGKERSHPFLPLPPLGLTFLVTGWRDRGDSKTAGWRDVKRQWGLREDAGSKPSTWEQGEQKPS